MSGPVDADLLHRSPTDLVSLLRGTVGALQAQAQALDIDLSIHASAGVPTLSVDGEKIAWAVMTLLRNAFRYVGHATDRSCRGFIRVRLRSEEGWVVVSVEDDDLGVAADRGEPASPKDHGVMYGTGLWLTLIEDVVGAHGGTVSTCETLPHGTSVTLRLPTMPNAGTPPAA